MKISQLLALFALISWTAACTRPTADGDGKAAPKAASATHPATKASSATRPPTFEIPTNWTPAVAKAYKKLRGARPEDRGQMIKGILALAKRGAAAEDALRRLTEDGALTERVRAMAGVMVVRLHRYDRAGLKKLLDSKNTFAAREAVLLFSQLGGVDAKKALEKAAVKQPAMATHIRHRLKMLDETSLPPRVEALLQGLLADTSIEKKKWAATALAVDYPQLSEKPLRGLLKMVVADRETQMQAAFALVMANKKKLKKLESFARPGNNRFLRYAAFDELMQLGAPGRKVVEHFAQKPGEKMRGHLRRLLKKS